jgi:glutamine synthetase
MINTVNMPTTKNMFNTPMNHTSNIKPKSIILEYIWLGFNYVLRSKYRTHFLQTNEQLTDIQQIPNWNYDGSSTGQAPGNASEINLVPVAFRPNPFFEKDKSFLVLCATYFKNGEPTPENTRHNAKAIFDKKLEDKPWFGIEQEYFIMAPNFTQDSTTPLAYSFETNPDTQNRKGGGRYYCGVGNQHIANRALAEKHYLYCLNADLNISGINSEVAPSQWEFQIGPCVGINAADEVWIARYILQKLTEEFKINISFEPKILDDINGSGLHTNFSTQETRDDGGLTKIREYLNKMQHKHKEHLEVYGVGNDKRLTGLHETSSIEKFTWKDGDRGASVRIPYTTIHDNKGYFEDRRPASNADPYLVTSIIFQTCCLE